MSPSRILLMRHAEKPDNPRDPGLSAAGEDRANRLTQYIPQKFGSINFLFASAPSKHSVRPIATVTPLSKRISVDIDQSIADQDYPVLVDELLTLPKYQGGSILVCWHHGFLPDMAHELRAPSSVAPPRWPSDAFNLIWELDYQTGGASTPAFKEITEDF
jgi:hypothetical protein